MIPQVTLCYVIITQWLTIHIILHTTSECTKQGEEGIFIHGQWPTIHGLSFCIRGASEPRDVLTAL